MPDQPKKSTYLVPRTCTRVAEKEEQPCSLESLRELDAYVLLGDPGIGKSESFCAEAEATGSVYQTARDFLTLSQPDLTGNTIFIDGLDENRASTWDEHKALDAIRSKLDAHGRPRFRISCREADWFGAPDRTALEAITPGRKLDVFKLDPLTKEDVVNILEHGSYELVDGAQFVEEAEKRGLDELLFNPQTLDILAKAIQSDMWPATKCEAYKLACERMAREHNEYHQYSHRGQKTASQSSILHAAGALSAILLIANLRGFSLTDSDEKAGHVSIGDVDLADKETSKGVIRSSLFKAVPERVFAPVHRTVAEYLAARFIATQVDDNRPSMQRVLTLICGDDGRPVAALRGLYAWLATLHPASRTRTIKQDPLGVVLYGDPSAFTAEEKMLTLRELRLALQEHPGSRTYSSASHPFGALATPDMEGFFYDGLRESSRDIGTQQYMDCLIDAVRYGAAMPRLKGPLLGIVRDATFRSFVRQNALKAYARLVSSSDLLHLAHEIISGKLSDEDDQLIGTLLQKLYPETISASDVVQFLHTPQQANLYGSYLYFWDYDFLRQTSDQAIATLLDALSTCDYLKTRQNSPDRLRLGRTIGQLVLRALAANAFQSHQQLYEWLGLLCCADDRDVDEADSQAIVNWLESHPGDHTTLLRIAIEATSDKPEPFASYGYAAERFHRAKWPPGMGAVLLEYADKEESPKRMDWLFAQAMATLFDDMASSGLTLDMVNQWVADRPRYAEYHREALYRPLDEWRMRSNEQEAARKVQEAAELASRHAYLLKHLPSLIEGSAPRKLLSDLAGLYLGNVSFRRETSFQSFSHYLCDDDQLIAAGLRALRMAPFRTDIPSPSEILEINGRKKQHCLQYPVLAGLTLLHEQGSEAIRSVPQSTLKSAIAFDLLARHGKDVAWRNELAQTEPALVSETLELFLRHMLARTTGHVYGLHALLHNPAYQDIARRILPSLIRDFPSSTDPFRTSNLFEMLAALSKLIDRQGTLDLVREKLAQKNLCEAHRLCVLAAGFLHAPDAYLDDISSIAADGEQRWQGLRRILLDDENWTKALMRSSNALAWLLAKSLPLATVETISENNDNDDEGSVGRDYTQSRNLRQLLVHLSRIPGGNAATQIGSLMNLPLHSYWQQGLRMAQADQRIASREANYGHPSAAAVSQTLLDREPANALDLAQILLIYLDELAGRISDGNNNIFRLFWESDRDGRPTPETENSCRDTLLALLKSSLVSRRIDAQPEGYYAQEKRADIRSSFMTGTRIFAIPTEIKRNTHPDVWKAIQAQLRPKYARDPESSGVGIYLVLWFGAKGMRRPPSGPSPRSAREMQAMLEDSLPRASRNQIFIRVIDCLGGSDEPPEKPTRARKIAPNEPKADVGTVKSEPKRPRVGTKKTPAVPGASARKTVTKQPPKTRAAAKNTPATKGASARATMKQKPSKPRAAKKTLTTKGAPSSARATKKSLTPAAAAKNKPEAQKKGANKNPIAKHTPAQAVTLKRTSAKTNPERVSSATPKSRTSKLPAVKKKAKAQSMPAKQFPTTSRKQAKPARAETRK